MKNVMLFAVAIVCGLILSVDVATGSPPASAFRASARQASGSKSGEDLFLDKCSTCHGTERALVAPRTKKGWEGVLAEMANLGAPLETGEQEAILGFLTERHGLVNVNAANAEELVGLGLSKQDADTIGSYRTEHGPFADFAALQRVPGLDLDRLNAVRERVAFRD
jgi:competence ComEA-like helix-hairpin-helix protein